MVNANERVINEKKQNRVMIHEQLTKAFKCEQILLSQISDIDDVTFELKDQVRQSNKERWSAMRGKKKPNEQRLNGGTRPLKNGVW